MSEQTFKPMFEVTQPLIERPSCPILPYVRILRPLDETDVVFDPPAYGDRGSGKQVSCNVRMRVIDACRAHLKEHGLEPFGFSRSEVQQEWSTTTYEPVRLQGCRTQASRVRKIEEAEARLHEKIDSGYAKKWLLDYVNNAIRGMVNGRNQNFIDEHVSILSRRVAPKWFKEHATGIGAREEQIRTLKAQMEPLQREIQYCREAIQAEMCDTLLAWLAGKSWTNEQGQPLPKEIREQVEPVLRERKAYGWDTFVTLGITEES